MNDIIYQRMKFQINKNNFTAALKDSLKIAGDITIPRSITDDSQEYIITKILTCSFLNNRKIVSIQFSDDSEVREIEKEAFCNSKLRMISLPPKIENLNGWADSATKINYISLTPENRNFKVIDHKLLIGKSSPKSDTFDSILFVSRYLQTVFVPSYIKCIKSRSFSYTKKLQTVEFSEDSQLQKIEKNAFFVSSIERINIPSKVEIIEDGWCNNTNNFIDVEFSSENKNFTYLDFDHNIVLSKSDLNLDYFDSILFGSREIERVSIPKYIKKICSGAFSACLNLYEVEIPKDSELQIIGYNAFIKTAISEIFIPSHVKVIDNCAFNECCFLEKIEFAEDSELELIDDYSFTRCSNLESIEIPSHVKKIGCFALSECELLNKVIFKENSEIESLYESSFAYMLIGYILIPKSLKIISKYAFHQCNVLKKIEFEKDSQLELIDDFAFAQTKLEKITIPKHVKKIGKSAFYFIDNLEEVVFERDSEIQTICENAFQNSGIFSLQIPEHLVDLQEGWCNGTEQLANIEISPKNKRFSMLNQEMIIGRNDSKSEIYDTLIFVCRDLNHVKIPSYIKHINPYALSDTLYRIDEISKPLDLRKIKYMDK